MLRGHMKRCAGDVGPAELLAKQNIFTRFATATSGDPAYVVYFMIGFGGDVANTHMPLYALHPSPPDFTFHLFRSGPQTLDDDG